MASHIKTPKQGDPQNLRPFDCLSLLIFTLAWIGQFIGHKIEGRKPSFFEDLAFLLIGPLWVTEAALRPFGKNIGLNLQYN